MNTINEPLRFKIPKRIRRLLRPYAYKLTGSLHSKKIELILKIKNESKLKTFVETGTFLGDTVDTLAYEFEKIYSIELDNKLYKRAKKIFESDNNIKIIRGDSADKLKSLLESLDEPALFWLDAHYSGEGTARADVDTPIGKEVKIILKHRIRSHVILIDDARLFNGSNGYPKIVNLKKEVFRLDPKKNFKIKDDMIIIE